jgi:hypothetical protein
VLVLGFSDFPSVSGIPRYATVLETGNSSPSDARAAAASCYTSLQTSALHNAFATPAAWAILTKMHDSTKMEITFPEAYIPYI